MKLIVLIIIVFFMITFMLLDQNYKLLKKISNREQEDKRYLKECKNSNIKYYPMGEEAYKYIIKELKLAKKYIFIEVFNITLGTMWDNILKILEEKVANGVEVRIIYDDLGCKNTLNINYPKIFQDKKIKYIVFNKINVIAEIFRGCRDHRKVFIVDGKVAFTGGINIDDSCINLNSKYGKWKDTVIKVEDNAAWNFTVFFLSMWNACKKEDTDYNIFRYKKNNSKVDNYLKTYIQNPTLKKSNAKDIYLNIINDAKEYIYITTPYLIIDKCFIKKLLKKVKENINITIIIPNIPDKKIVYLLTESYANELIENGIKIYKYTPGFIHSKMFVCDDKIATVGTVNLDYRSLYLNYECGVVIKDNKVIKEIKKDIENTLKESKQMKKEESKVIKKIFQRVLRIFAPLL